MECRSFRPVEAQSLSYFEPEYLAALDEIFHSDWVARKLVHINNLRQEIQTFWPNGHPAKLIMLTGTNGKGSFAFALEQMCRSRFKMGLWIGPHVFDYAERIRVNGVNVSHDEIADMYWTHIRPVQERRINHRELPLTFAEMGILMALMMFDRHRVQWAVMEVGAGGRYAPLNALDFAAMVVTNIGNDHPKTLGRYWWQRALEKVGIARQSVPLFTGAPDLQLPFVRKIAACTQVYQANDRCIQWARQCDATEHRVETLALAATLAQWMGVTLTDSPAVKWEEPPARYQWHTPQILLDMAHNRDKISALVARLQMQRPDCKVHALIGLSRDRDPRQVFEPLFQLDLQRIVVTSASYAGVPPDDLAMQISDLFPKVQVQPDPERALADLTAELPHDHMILVTGSAYLIDQAMNPNLFVKESNASFGRRL